MKQLWAQIGEWRAALSRLSQREQLLVAAGVGVISLLLLIGIGAWVSTAIAREAHRVQSKGMQLEQLLALQEDYHARELERADRLAVLQRAQVRLVSWVEDAAGQSGVNIGQLRPEDSEPGADGIRESKVELRASGLSADKLQAFINTIESSNNAVMIRRLKINRPYSRDLADIEMSVSAFKVRN